MDISFENRKKISRWVIGTVAVCIVIFLGVQNLDVLAESLLWAVELVMPLVVGFAFALVFNVPMRILERRLWPNAEHLFLVKLRRPCAFIISLILIFGILVGLVWLVIPELVNAVKVIVQGLMDLVNQLNAIDKEEILKIPFGKEILNFDWNQLLTPLQTWLKNQSGNIMNTAFGTITSLVGGIFDFFISFVFAIYILFGQDKLKKQSARLVRAWMPEKLGGWLIHAFGVMMKNFHNFVSGQTIEALIIGVLCMVGMWILRLPYAPMVGALVGVTALIPVVGAYIGAFVGAFMILTISPMKALVFLIYLVVLQQLEGNLIYPKVMGSKVNLPGIWILAAVTLGGGLGGPLGMLLSVPVASTVYVLLKEATEKREEMMVRS